MEAVSVAIIIRIDPQLCSARPDAISQNEERDDRP